MAIEFRYEGVQTQASIVRDIAERYAPLSIREIQEEMRKLGYSINTKDIIMALICRKSNVYIYRRVVYRKEEQ